jgi:hypothetical protein
MSGIGFLLLCFLVLHLFRPSMGRNLMFLTSEYGGALPMCIYNEISTPLFSLTVKNAFSLDTLLATKAGSSTTQSQSKL